MVDEALGEGGGQHQFALGDGDEAVPQAHNLEVGGSNPPPATIQAPESVDVFGGFFLLEVALYATVNT